MRRKSRLSAIALNFSNRSKGRGSSQCRLQLEPLEERQLLSAVPWTIDSDASTLSIAIPDQPITLNGTDATIQARNQSGGNSGPWNVGNTAHFAGTIDTEYVDGSAIQFLAGQTNFLGVNSGSYRPDPADYTGGTINPDGTASGGDFTGTAIAPGVFGARFRATVQVFGFPVTVDAAFASFYDTKYEIASDALPITAGSFPINTTNIGISDTLVAVDGLTVVTSQPVPDSISRITDAVGPDGELTATIANTGPLTRRLTIPISLALSIPVDNDPSHNLAATATGTIVADATMTAPESTIVGRHLFYNQSGTSTRYDHNDLAINSFDDAAIASDKTAYLWEDAGAATFANVSSYTKGINGIMVDISGSHPSITAADFIFKVGNNNSPGTWSTANAPTSVSVRAGAGVSGSDRVEIIWNGAAAPIKQWLEVITLANANTGLAQEAGHPAGHGDAFFFGNAVGNTGLGDTTANSLVTATDEAAIRANPALVSANIPITNIYDVNRSASVSAVDESAARLNGTNPTTTLKYLNLTTAPAAPEAEVFAGDGDIAFAGDEEIASASGVASALTAPTTTSGGIKIPGWIANRLDSIDLNSGNPARLFQHLHDVNTPGSRKLLQKFDAVADALSLDDELLDSLLADLGLEK
jgi:hypothetical protein